METSADFSFDPHVLLEHQGFVRSLARRLARDEDEAEELEQDAWVVALEKEQMELREPRVWLARVLHTLSLTRRRAEARRREHEARGARGEAVDERFELDRMSARLAIAQAVVAAVLELDEPYREVILLRHFGGLGPQDIAAELGVPLETARTRLRRAHERLRERLDRQEGGRERWAPALLAWTIDPRGSGEATAATSAAGGLGGMIMLAGTAVVAAVAIGAGLALFEGMRSAPAGGGVEVVAVAGETFPQMEGGGAVAASEPGGEAADPVVRRAVAAPPAPGWWLVGSLKGAESSEQPARLTLRDERGELLLETEASAAGFELPLDGHAQRLAGSLAIELAYDHPDLLPGAAWVECPASFALAADERRELRVPLEPQPPAGFVQGAVEASGGAAPDGVVAALFELDAEGTPEAEPVERAALRAGERFRLRARRLGPHALLAEMARPDDLTAEAAATLLAPTTRRVAVLEGAESAEILPLSPGATISGRAVDASGAGRAGHVVSVQLSDPVRVFFGLERPLAWKDGRFQHASVRALTGPDGSFCVSGLAEDQHVVELGGTLQQEDAVIPMVSGGVAQRDVRAPASNLVLRRQVRERLLRVTCEGRPVAGAEVALPSAGVQSGGAGTTTVVGFGGRSVVPGEIDRRDPSIARTDEQGRMRVVTGAGVRPTLFVNKDGYMPGFLAPRPGEDPGDELRVELRSIGRNVQLAFMLPASSISPGLQLRVELEPIEADGPKSGESVQSGQMHVSTVTVGPGGLVRSGRAELLCAVPADGRVEVGGFTAGRYSVQVTPIRDRGTGPPALLLPTSFDLELADGADVARPLELEPGGGLELFVPESAEGIAVSVFDAAEQPVELRFHPMAGSGWREAGSALAPGPYEAVRALAAGDYTLVTQRGGTELARQSLTIRAGERARMRLAAHER